MTYPWTAGEVLTAADLNAYAGLVLVKTQTIGSAVSSVTVNGAFSSTFDNYRILIAGGVGSTNLELKLQMGATTTGYYSGLGYHAFSVAGPSNVQGIGQSNVANFSYCGACSTNGMMFNAEVFAPNLARQTCVTANIAINNTSGSIVFTNGFLNNTTQYTAFTVLTSTGTITGGTIRVYGYNNG